MDVGIKKLRLFGEFVFLILIICACTIALADEEDDTAQLYMKGARHLRLHRWAQAEQAFTEVLERWPGQPDVHALLGIARYHQSKYREALQDLALALEKGTRYTARALYYQGLAYSELGRSEYAAAAFERLITQFPNSAEAMKVKSLEIPRPPARPRVEEEKPNRFSFLFIQDVNRDSNAPLTQDPDPDTMLFTFASLKLSLHPLPFYMKSSLMVQEYFHEDDFDFVQLAGGVHGEISPTQDDTLRGAYTLKRFWLDDKELGSGYQAQLAWEHGWVADVFSDFSGNYARKVYDEDYNEEVTGYRSEGQMRLWWLSKPLNPLTRIRAGGLVSSETAKDDYLAYRSWRASLEFEFTLSERITTNVELTFGERVYRDVYPGYLESRFDQRFSAGASLLTKLFKYGYLRLNVRYLSSDSNIKEHNYYKTLYGAGIMLLF
jgi:outer membrane protein assembly factor BamD (BamD/ComL family)